jgi:hypothetical protein
MNIWKSNIFMNVTKNTKKFGEVAFHDLKNGEFKRI